MNYFYPVRKRVAKHNYFNLTYCLNCKFPATKVRKSSVKLYGRLYSWYN